MGTRGRTAVTANVVNIIVSPFFFGGDLLCYHEVITTALWGRNGSAVVSVHPPAASVGSSVRFL